MKTDVLVIGAGIAGLSFAIKVANARPDVSVLVLTKSDSENCNTARAQGGIAVVLDKVKDSFEQHIEDTIKSGKGLNNRKVVEMVVSKAPERLQELIQWGTSFDSNELGELELGLEGGHSQKRIVHHKDFTGMEMESKLLSRAESLSNITFIDYYFVTDLVVEQFEAGRCCKGIKVLDRGNRKEISIGSKLTFLATGGSGRIFKNTTNPSVATGDGIAMAYRAGATISKMNFFQFHPTALYTKDAHALFLISEAVRGFGAHLVDSEGKRFMFKYDLQGELATRDVVSAAIVEEMRSSGEDSVFLDCRHLEVEAFAAKFPTIVEHCSSLGLDLKKDLIPVVPAAHYQCGGIAVDKFSRTSIENLYASGECAYTGLHGSNRLASNSLLEALVFSHQAAVKVIGDLDSVPVPDVSKLVDRPYTGYGAAQWVLEKLRKDLNETMTYNLLHSYGITGKEVALDNLKILQAKLKMYPDAKNPDHWELKNMIQTAQIILQQAVEYELQAQKSQSKLTMAI